MRKLPVVMFLAVSALSAYSISRTVGDIYQKSKRVSAVRGEIASLEEENKELIENLAYESTKEFVEKEAKEKLFMGRPGESVLIVPKDILDKISQFPKSPKESDIPVWVQWERVLRKGF